MESGLFMNVNLVIVRKGEMTPLQWYYYDGTYVEPHQGTQMNKEFVIMTVNHLSLPTNTYPSIVDLMSIVLFHTIRIP